MGFAVVHVGFAVVEHDNMFSFTKSSQCSKMMPTVQERTTSSMHTTAIWPRTQESECTPKQVLVSQY